jgi:PAS domain-containing protein
VADSGARREQDDRRRADEWRAPKREAVASGANLLAGFEAATLDGDANVVYALDSQLRLAYVNPAWHRFARENGAASCISQHYRAGTPVLDAIAGPLRDFYAEAWRRALEGGAVWQHDYECSSADRYRVFHQTVYPLRGRGGLVVVNSLVVDNPMALEERAAAWPVLPVYRNADGLITQCSHCRRVQRADDSPRWDWVPAWVSDPLPETSHGLCPFCYDYYYRYCRR